MGGKVSFPVITLPKERTVIVTGATAGIGYETAKWIAMMGATVIIACRSEEKSMEAIKRMNKECKELKDKGTEGLADVEELGVEYMNLELSSFKSTKEFVEAFKKSGRQLHVLICNAGIMARNYVKTDDGFESSLQVNYLSHFLMIGQLLPVMMKSDSDDVRIVLVSADLHRIPRLYDTNQINYSGDPNKYSMLTSYSRSKLYQIMQMYCLQRRLRNTNISVTSLHPGVIQTELTRDYNEVWWFRTMKSIGRVKEMVSKPTTALEGATTTIYAAISPEMKGVSGMYLKDCKEGGVSATARDERKQEELWTKTMEFLKEQLTEEEILVLEGKHGDTSKG